jgi:predicted dehydrogenase
LKPLRTVLVGYGRIAAGYINDEVMLKHIKYATHAQVLNEHPHFEWVGIIEKNIDIVKIAEKNIWGIKNIVNHPGSLEDLDLIDVIVLATPAEVREEIIKYFPKLRAVIVEKPLGIDCLHARKFLNICKDRDIAVAVNITRRYDDKLYNLLDRKIKNDIGAFQCGFGVYGNGLINNGTHLVDLIRMLFGEVKSVRAIKQEHSGIEDNLKFNPCFSLELESGGYFNIQSIDFLKYREMNLDIWCANGRLTFWHETLKYQIANVFDHPYATNEKALNIENSEFNYLNLGSAQYHLYDNLYDHLISGESLLCDGEEALKTMAIIDNIKESSHFGDIIYTNFAN